LILLPVTPDPEGNSFLRSPDLQYCDFPQTFRKLTFQLSLKVSLDNQQPKTKKEQLLSHLLPPGTTFFHVFKVYEVTQLIY